MRTVSIGLLLFCLIAAELVAENRVVEASRQYIIERFDFDPDATIVEMRDNRSFDALLPTDSLRAYSTSSSPPPGNYLMKYDILRDGVIVKTISAPVKVTVWMDVYIAKTRIKRGEAVQREDLAVERRDITRDVDDVIRTSEPLGKVRAKRTIAEGSVVEREMVELIPDICRGDEVLITCHVGPVEITTTGFAREDGCLGDMIEVVNQSTKRRITAEVESPGIVTVAR